MRPCLSCVRGDDQLNRDRVRRAAWVELRSGSAVQILAASITVDGREGLAFSCRHQAAGFRSSAPSHSGPLIRRSKTLPLNLSGSFRVKWISTPAFYSVCVPLLSEQSCCKIRTQGTFQLRRVSCELLLLICSAANSACQPRCLAWRPSPRAPRESQIPAVKAQEAVTSFEGYESSCYLPLPAGGGGGGGGLSPGVSASSERRLFGRTRQPPRADADMRLNNKTISKTVCSSSLAGPRYRSVHSH